MAKTNKRQVDINTVISNEDNPRFITDENFEKLVASIKAFPEMLEKRPIVVDENMVSLGGNMRLKASIKAGLKKIWIDQAIGWTEEQKKEFVIKDNASFGSWDWDILKADYDIATLPEWGIDVLNFGNEGGLKKVNSENEEWVEMPQFSPVENPHKIIISFRNEEDRQEFADKYKMKFMQKQSKSWSTWYPYRDREDLSSLKYEEK